MIVSLMKLLKLAWSAYVLRVEQLVDHLHVVVVALLRLVRAAELQRDCLEHLEARVVELPHLARLRLPALDDVELVHDVAHVLLRALEVLEQRAQLALALLQLLALLACLAHSSTR